MLSMCVCTPFQRLNKLTDCMKFAMNIIQLEFTLTSCALIFYDQ
jgi:hypothetical protein